MTANTLRIVSRGKDHSRALLSHLPRLWLHAPLRIELACADADDTEAALDAVGSYSLTIQGLTAARVPDEAQVLWYSTESPILDNSAKSKGPHAVFDLSEADMANITAAGEYWIALHAYVSGERIVRAAGYVTFVDDGFPDTPPTPTPPGTVYLTQAAGDSRYVKDPGTVVDNTLVRWDGISGGSVQGSAVTVADNGSLTTPGTVTGSSLKADNGAFEGEITADLLTLDRTFDLPDSSSTVLAATDNVNGAPDRLEIYAKCDEVGGVTLGQAVYIYGANGGNKLIRKAIASGESTSTKTIGIVAQALAHNAFGYVVTEGPVTVSLPKGTAVEGDSVWLSPSTSGGVVFGLANKPSAPNHMVFMGYVTRITGTNITEIFVKVQNGFELEELHNVAISTPSTGQTIFWNGTLWANRAIGASDFGGTATNGYVLTVVGGNPQWAEATGGGGGSVTVTGQDGIGVAGSPGTSITLSLGNITPDSVTSSGVISADGGLTIGTGVLKATLSTAHLGAASTVFLPEFGGNLAVVSGTSGDILAADVTDATTVGRNVLTAVDADAGRTALGLGTLATRYTVGEAQIDNQAVTNAKLAEVPPSTFKGNPTTGTTQAPVDMTPAEAAAILPVFTSSVKGLAPSSGGGSVNFLRADGSWAAPVGGSKALPAWSVRDNEPPLTGFATLDTRNSQRVLNFDDGTAGLNERAVFRGIIPAEFSLTGGFKVRIHWFASSINTAHRVKWTAEVERENTDASSDSFGDIHSALGTPSGSQFVPVYTEITLTTIDGLVAGEPYRLRITRDASDTVNDTMVGDAQLFMVQVIGN